MERNTKFKYECIHKCLLRAQTCFGIWRTSIWRTWGIKTYSIWNLIKNKQKQRKKPKPNNNKTNPTTWDYYYYYYYYFYVTENLEQNQSLYIILVFCAWFYCRLYSFLYCASLRLMCEVWFKYVMNLEYYFYGKYH